MEGGIGKKRGTRGTDFEYWHLRQRDVGGTFPLQAFGLKKGKWGMCGREYTGRQAEPRCFPKKLDVAGEEHKRSKAWTPHQKHEPATKKKGGLNKNFPGGEKDGKKRGGGENWDFRQSGSRNFLSTSPFATPKRNGERSLKKTVNN